jgi:hypothetical protein
MQFPRKNPIQSYVLQKAFGAVWYALCLSNYRLAKL